MEQYSPLSPKLADATAHTRGTQLTTATLLQDGASAAWPHDPPLTDILAMSSPEPLPVFSPVNRADDEMQLDNLESHLRIARLQLHRVDDPHFYPFELRRAECKLDRMRSEQREATDEEQAEIYRMAAEIGKRVLCETRDRVARFNADPQRFIIERRQELTVRIKHLHKHIAKCRQSLDKPPVPYPLNLPYETAPLSTPTPPDSPSATVMSSLHRRR